MTRVGVKLLKKKSPWLGTFGSEDLRGAGRKRHDQADVAFGIFLRRGRQRKRDEIREDQQGRRAQRCS